VNFSHVFISRPRREGEELAAMLTTLGLESVLQPAFDYVACDLRREDPQGCARFSLAGPSDLVVFTSPRAVQHGLPQLDRGALARARVLAVGPATAGALEDAGMRVEARANEGFTSEALLEALAGERETGAAEAGAQPRSAFIIAAPGGRQALFEGLQELGWLTSMLMVYRSEPASLEREALAALDDATAVLSVWTSGNAMTALSRRLPAATWLLLCRGPWLVVSERLARLARTFGPSGVHLAAGPGNGALLEAIRGLA
jgi:uroporphyrinogen-III synthase